MKRNVREITDELESELDTIKKRITDVHSKKYFRNDKKIQKNWKKWSKCIINLFFI